ncbi:MAG: ATP-dependent helicase [Kiritimatiellae bacterium]|nr:ATP-dependent helicase [Kiritimatiellia bacterium]
MAGIAFEQELNGEQFRAVTAPDGPVLIIAAAGTGKTRTLTYRVAYLVERGIDPRRILLLTFTNKAAREMLERARGLVGEGVSGLWGGTFHHMANRMLRQHAEAIGYRNDYSILDQDDAKRLVKQSVEEVHPVKDKLFPKPDVLLSVFGLASSKDVSIDSIAEQRFADSDVDTQVVGRIGDVYRKRKQEANAMDFDDLLANGLKLFRDNPDLLDRYRERFLHILVDEYQDTNHIQSEWVDQLASFHRNLLVVGDDFQSIYSWRGADFRNILTYPERYPDASVFKLETNYRSVPEILELANACIAGNPEQFQKTLRPVRDAHVRPTSVRVRDGDHQAMFVVDTIRRLRSEGYPASEIAILYRSHYHAMELQFYLDREGIRYTITSGMRFFEQAHIKDAVSLLRLHANPWDRLAFARFVELFPKLGAKTALKIWNLLGQKFHPGEAAAWDTLIKGAPAATRPLLMPVRDKIEAVYLKESPLQPGTLLQAFVDAYYADYAVATYDNADRRLEDVEELIRFTGKFVGIEDFLNEMSLLTNMDGESDDPHGDDPNTIRLSTVHQAKGLEWAAVIVIWMADGMFPSGRSISETDDDSEERRLFYVAVTRARDELYLCSPAMRRGRDGSVQYYTPSRFVQEIPSTLTRSITMGMS